MLHALVREVARARLSRRDEEPESLQRRAATWFEAHGHFEDALRSLVAAGDAQAISRLLSERGSALTKTGAFRAIIEAGASLPAEFREGPTEVAIAEAHLAVGELERGRELLARAAERSETRSPQLAARIGLAYLDRPRKALALLQQTIPEGLETEDAAFTLALLAQVLCALGDADAGRKHARRALGAAREHGWRWAEAEAHLSLGMAANAASDLRAAEAHHRSALEAAERGGNIAQISTAHLRTATLLIEWGRCEDALRELEPALRLSDLSGHANLRAWARCLRAEAWLRLGRLDEARAEFEAGAAIYRRAGSRIAGRALRGIGDVHRERGELALARSAYEEAVALVEEPGILVDLVAALAALARVLVGEDEEEAARVAGRAVALAPHVAALLAAGWVALWRGARDEARALAGRAAAEARRRGNRAGLAESLELEALSAAEPPHERRRLEEVVAIWHELTNPLGEARAELALARLSKRTEARAAAERAERRLRALGVRPEAAAGAAGLLAALPRAERAPVAIQVLGGFRVVRDGVPAGLEAWRRSLKAQELLKILVARRGRPTPRDVLTEALWPGDDPEQLRQRLSVALATVRRVLDPERLFAPDHYVRADGDALVLELSRLPVDVERFLALADAGFSLRREGRAAEAVELFEAAEQSYAGDFLEEDLYEDWAGPLREEARASYLAVTRVLAETAAAAGDHDVTVRYLLRMLERDPYDEGVHLFLVSTLSGAGHHGEARRRYLVYAGRMEEIGVEPAPFPAGEGTPALSPV
jgi:DNA-binding SARP family transcriptional activator